MRASHGGEGPSTEVPGGLVQTTGLPERTGRCTVPDMFRRHHTAPDRGLELVASALHDRLAASTVTLRTDSPRIDALAIRGRLGGSASVGLRDRIAQARLHTA